MVSSAVGRAAVSGGVSISIGDAVAAVCAVSSTGAPVQAVMSSASSAAAKRIICFIARSFIRILDMEKFADNRIEKLSTGQTQRASIARCLMADPQLYILDEPTLGLDIISADGIIRFMKEQKHKGKTVLYSTHYLEEAQELCNRIYMICQGRIVAEGTPEELMEKTGTHSLREAFHYIFNNLEDVEGGQKNE